MPVEKIVDFASNLPVFEQNHMDAKWINRRCIFIFAAVFFLRLRINDLLIGTRRDINYNV